MGQKTPHDCSQSVNSHGAKETHSYLFIIISYLSPRSGRFRVIVCRHSHLFLYRFLGCIVTGRVRALVYRYKVGSVSVCGTVLPAPGFLHTGRGSSKPPGSPGWRPLPGSKAFGLQQPTGYHLFTIHSYLLPSPTQVGDAGRVRAVMYPYKPRSIIVCRH